jgi:hypothetical protein
MSDKAPYNEPALPVVSPTGEQFSGMMLRDYFAAKALPTCLSQFPIDVQRACQLAYYIADEMLSARSNNHD